MSFALMFTQQGQCGSRQRRCVSKRLPPEAGEDEGPGREARGRRAGRNESDETRSASHSLFRLQAPDGLNSVVVVQ